MNRKAVVKPFYRLFEQRKLSFPAISSTAFIFFIAFNFEFFLHLSSRVPGISALRPTLLLVLVCTGLLFSQKKIFKTRPESNVVSIINGFLIFLLLTLPFVSFPGSVIKTNIPILLKAIVFFYFTYCCVDTPKRLKIFLIVFVGCQIFRVLEPLYMNITQGYWGDSTYMGHGEFASRLAGSPYDVINPNELGFVIATCVPFLHFLLFPRGLILKIIYGGLMVCLLYALILTMSRGAFLALLVVAFVVFKESKNKSLLIVVGIVIAIAGWSVMTPVQKDRYLSLVSSDSKGSKTVDGRLNGMLNEFKVGFQRPIFGHGIGTSGEAKYHALGDRQASHNLYAELVMEIGLLGMVIFLKYFVRIYKELKRIRGLITPGDVEYEQILKTLMTVYFMYLVYSSNYWGLTQGYWYLFGGLVVAFGRIVSEQVNENSSIDNIKNKSGSLI